MYNLCSPQPAIFKRSFRGVQLVSAGYYLSRRTIYVFEPLRTIVPATHSLKLLIVACEQQIMLFCYSVYIRITPKVKQKANFRGLFILCLDYTR